MSLNYFLSCKKNYDSVIQYLGYIINIFDDINYTACDLENFDDSCTEMCNSTRNKQMFIDKLEYITKLRDICNHKLEQLCEHNYIEDTIDITPERSQTITYCTICEYTKHE